MLILTSSTIFERNVQVRSYSYILKRKSHNIPYKLISITKTSRAKPRVSLMSHKNFVIIQGVAEVEWRAISIQGCPSLHLHAKKAARVAARVECCNYVACCCARSPHCCCIFVRQQLLVSAPSAVTLIVRRLGRNCERRTECIQVGYFCLLFVRPKAQTEELYRRLSCK